MKRNLDIMGSKVYDIAIIGGGITGACVAWDASLRGLTVALVDKGDFSSGTSFATSKLIHGGLRYLKTMEVGLVRESLHERRIMEIIAPHLVYPLPFVFPAYGWGMRGLPAITSAMVLYDTLAYDKKWLNDDDKKIPGHKKLSTEATLDLEPGIDSKDMKGSVIYYDCQMYSPERLVLEFILGADEYGVDVANYAKVEEFIKGDDTIEGIHVRDLLSNKEYDIKAKVTINAAGPWGDYILGLLHGKTRWSLVRSKGIHIITRSITKSHGVVLQTRSGRHFFAIPWRGYSLIGTTDVVYKGDPDDCRVTESDITEFINEIDQVYPSAKLTRDDVLYAYAGLRPIVEKDTSVEVDVYDVSRKYEIYDHEKDDGIKGLITAAGGKYTTSRNLAKKLVELAYEKLNKDMRPCITHTTPLYGGEIGRYASFVERAKKRKIPGISDATIETLCRNYGSRYLDVLAIAGKNKKNKELICERYPDIMAEVIYAVRTEMAMKLSDVIFRRTGVGTLGSPGDNIIEKVADVMAKELNWDKNRKNMEIDHVLDNFVPLKI
ncbi:MAG: glycerol-3-phosphate dehydrogenase/oxidase [Deltaproteobacteria bacterium]|nr:glycerol-3-phosphate dehydrogenase/oxidase [Deltaproteobacteria bacterium]